jgi:hypothetical protein
MTVVKERSIPADVITVATPSLPGARSNRERNHAGHSVGWRKHLRAEKRLANIAAANAAVEVWNAPYIAAREEEARKRAEAARLAARNTRYTPNWWERD